MSLITQLVGFGLRQVIGDNADSVVQIVEIVELRFRDHSRTLPKALEQAHNRAWQALGVALAGDGLLDRMKVFFASGDDKGVREQVQLFLKSNAFSFDGTPAEFRQACLDELKRLRKSGLLSTQAGSSADIARQAAGFKRHTDPQGLIEESRRAVAVVADALADAYPNLARLLRTPTPAGPPLLAAAFCYFFRREVETDDELAHGLFFDGLRQLSASQAKAFGEVGKALAALGGQFDALFEQLGRIEAAVVETHAVAVETHGAVLDLQAELQRLGGLHLANAGEVRSLLEQVLSHLSQVGMTRGEVRPGNSCSIRGEAERRAVKALLARFRQLPAEEQRQAPALLNGLGKLQVGAGDFAEAQRTFTEVVQVVGSPSDKAEASYNAYRAALEEKKWDAALAALREAGSHDPQRFAPFPLHRYEPKRILGAGGFGTAILCLDRHFDEDVVVKTLHAADLARGVDEVFREARTLRRLSHPAIIGVRDCEYADSAAKARPYLVMDYFSGGSLEQFVEQRGTVTWQQLLPLAWQLAQGMQVAHSQGILHRDLKPANVLVRKEGDLWKVKIIDFGLALQRQRIETSAPAGSAARTILGESVAGTLKYAPPEQMGEWRGVKPGFYSDVYAFGKLCFHALFKNTEPRSRLLDLLPKPLRGLLERSVEQDIAHRCPDFGAFLEVLTAIQPDGMEAREGGRAEKVWERGGGADEQTQGASQSESQLAKGEGETTQLQQVGETKLIQFLQTVLDRTSGHPSREDNAAAGQLLKQYGIPKERAKQILQDVQQRWKTRAARRYSSSANASLETGDLDRAIADANEAIRLDSKNASSYLVRAQAFLKKGEKDRSFTDANAALRLEPGSALGYAARAQALLKKWDLDRAVADATQAIRLDQKSAFFYAIRSQAYVMKNQLERAVADANEALRLDAQFAFGYAVRAQAFAKKVELDRAVADATQAIRLDPNCELAFTVRASAYVRMGERELGLKDVSEAIRIDPRSAHAYAVRSLIHLATGRIDLGFADAGQAVCLDPLSSMSYGVRALAYLSKEDKDLGLADAVEAIRLDHQNPIGFGARGAAYLQMGEADRAAADATQAVRLDPQYAYAYYIRCQAYLKKGEMARAITEASAAIRLLPKMAGLYVVRARSHLANKDATKAIADATEALRLDPKAAASYEIRARAYLMKGEAARAIPEANAAIALNPKIALAFAARGVASRMQGAFQKAVTDLTEAVRLDPSSTWARTELDLARRGNK